MYNNNLVLSLKQISYEDLEKVFKDQEVDLVPLNSKYSKETVFVNGYRGKKKVSTFDTIMLIFQEPVKIEFLKTLFHKIGIEIRILGSELLQA